MSRELNARRMAAAVASGGMSSDEIYATTLRLLGKRNVCGRLLEFGAGTGNLVRRLVDSGFVGSISAVDMLPRPPGTSSRVTWITSDLNEPVPIAAESFDAIVSTEVIEHLENPRAVFREFRRLLRPGGLLLATTPNQESIRSLAALVGRGHFVAFLGRSYPAHITALLRRDFRRICEETGFDPPQFHYTSTGAVPRMTRLRWQNLLGGFAKGRLFSDNVAVVTRRHE